MKKNRILPAVFWAFAIAATTFLATDFATGGDIFAYSRCYFRGCHCRSFVGTTFTCKNCGHNRDYH
ncbi:MAG: hypothetical protein R3C01_02140 [Planctomycetaceae bacterium]